MRGFTLGRRLRHDSGPALAAREWLNRIGMLLQGQRNQHQLPLIQESELAFLWAFCLSPGPADSTEEAGV